MEAAVAGRAVRAGSKGNIEVPSSPWAGACSFVPPPASSACCLVLGAWCCTFALAHGLPAAPSNLISRKVPHASESSFRVWPCPPFHPGRRIGRWTVIDWSALSREGGRVTHQHPKARGQMITTSPSWRLVAPLALLLRVRFSELTCEDTGTCPDIDSLSHRRSIGPRGNQDQQVTDSPLSLRHRASEGSSPAHGACLLSPLGNRVRASVGRGAASRRRARGAVPC